MLHSTSLSGHGARSIQPSRPTRRLRVHGPTAALLAMTAVFASGLAAGLISPPHAPAHMASQPQPFDHFPR